MIKTDTTTRSPLKTTLMTASLGIRMVTGMPFKMKCQETLSFFQLLIIKALERKTRTNFDRPKNESQSQPPDNQCPARPTLGDCNEDEWVDEVLAEGHLPFHEIRRLHNERLYGVSQALEYDDEVDRDSLDDESLASLSQEARRTKPHRKTGNKRGRPRKVV